MSLFTITVPRGQVALVRKDGEPTRALEPGRHRRALRASYLFLDTRERLTPVAPQEVLTTDGVTLKVTVVLRWRIADPVRFVEHTEDAVAVVYLATQVALRDALSALDTDAVLHTARADVARLALDAATTAADVVGVEVVEVVVKDVVLPVELRAAYAAVVTGRQRALAQLEAARAETAALRSLANGAKILEDHPALARQRLVEALPPGATVTL